MLKKYAVYLPTVVLLLTTMANAATPAIATFWMNHATAAEIFAPLAGCLRRMPVSTRLSEPISKNKVEETIYEESSCRYAVTCHVLHRVFDRLGIDARFHLGSGGAGIDQYIANRRRGQRSAGEQQLNSEN